MRPTGCGWKIHAINFEEIFPMKDIAVLVVCTFLAWAVCGVIGLAIPSVGLVIAFVVGLLLGGLITENP